jgi:hypothetical protein
MVQHVPGFEDRGPVSSITREPSTDAVARQHGDRSRVSRARRGDLPGEMTRLEAEVSEIERALRGYRVLTRRRLEEICHARRWREPLFESALSAAIDRGAVVKLTDDLYELNENAA